MAPKNAGSTNYKFSYPAYTLAVYHTLKHPSETCCGVFLGRQLDGGKTVVFERCVPLTHTQALSPTLKLACIAAETLAKKSDEETGKSKEQPLEIVGFYCANRVAFSKPDSLYAENSASISSSLAWLPLYKGIFEKIQANCPKATAWLLNGAMVSNQRFAFQGYTNVVCEGDKARAAGGANQNLAKPAELLNSYAIGIDCVSLDGENNDIADEEAAAAATSTELAKKMGRMTRPIPDTFAKMAERIKKSEHTLVLLLTFSFAFDLFHFSMYGSC